jgi:hypothetical protein
MRVQRVWLRDVSAMTLDLLLLNVSKNLLPALIERPVPPWARSVAVPMLSRPVQQVGLQQLCLLAVDQLRGWKMNCS